MTKSINLKIVSNCLIALSLLLVAFAIFQIGLYTREKCLIASYENKIFHLSESNKSLAVNFSKVSSLANIDNYVSDKKFTEPQNIKYLQVLEGPIAAKK